MNTQGKRKKPDADPGRKDTQTERFRTLSVLCVYEDPLFLDRICRNLEENDDIFVEISVSVEDALHLMVYVFFDIVITDFTSWDNKEHGFLNAVRQQGKDVPFIYFTHGKPAGTVKGAKQYGNVEFISWDEGVSAVPFEKLSRCIHVLAGRCGE